MSGSRDIAHFICRHGVQRRLVTGVAKWSAAPQQINWPSAARAAGGFFNGQRWGRSPSSRRFASAPPTLCALGVLGGESLCAIEQREPRAIEPQRKRGKVHCVKSRCFQGAATAGRKWTPKQGPAGPFSGRRIQFCCLAMSPNRSSVSHRPPAERVDQLGFRAVPVAFPRRVFRDFRSGGNRHRRFVRGHTRAVRRGRATARGHRQYRCIGR